MKKITLEINNSIYDYIMFFLENIPKNLVNIRTELQVSNNNNNEVSSSSFNPRDFFGASNSSKAEIDDYLKQNQNEWDNYLDKR